MNEVWEWVKEGGLVQGILALLFGGTIVYLSITQQPVSEVLAGLTGVAVTFYYQDRAAARQQRQLMRGLDR